MARNRNAHAALIAILLVSGFLRFYGLGWGTDPETGEFHRFHPDETTVVEGASWVGRDLSRVVTAYAKAPVYLLWAVANGAGTLSGVEPFGDDNRSAKFTHLLGRGISAALGTLTVWVVFGIGCRLFGTWTGVLSAALLGFCALHIQQSHYYTVDVSFAFWIALGVYLILKMPSDRMWPYLACGLSCGLAAGTRLLGGVLGLPFLIAHLWPTGASADLRKFRAAIPWRQMLTPRVAMCGATVLLIAFLCSPYLLLAPDQFFSDSGDIRNFMPSVQVTRGEMVRVWVLYDFSTTPYLFYLTNLLRFAMGLPLEIAALCGVLLALWRRDRGGWVLLGWLVPYFFLVAGFHAKPIRYTVPMLPLLSVLGAWACMQAGRWLCARTNRLFMYALPVALVGLPTALYGVSFLRIYHVENSRFQAARWVREHIPEGDAVLAERGGFPTAWMVPEDRYRRRIDDASFFIYAEGRYPYWAQIDFAIRKLAGTNWIVLIEENRMRQYLEVPDRYPIGYGLYHRLASGELGFERVASFKESPGILGWRVSETDAEPTLTAFDHPRVSIYRRTDADVEGLLAKWKADVEADPRFPDRHIRAGVDAYRRGDFESAVEAFHRAAEVRPGFSLGYLLASVVRIRQKRRAEAERESRKAMDIAPIIEHTFIGVIKSGLKSEGAGYLEWYLKGNPGRHDLARIAARARFDSGVEYHRQKRYKEAIAEYRRSAKLDSGYAPTFQNLGALYMATGRHDEAVAALERVVRLGTSQADVWFALAQLHRLKGDLEEAHEAVLKALELDPANPSYRAEHFNLGSTLHTQGRLDRALDIYREALAYNPRFPEAYLNLGILHYDRGRYAESAAAFQQAVQLAPDDPEGHMGLAQAYEKTGRIDDAVREYRRTLALNPDHSRARAGLDALLRRGAPR